MEDSGALLKILLWPQMFCRKDVIVAVPLLELVLLLVPKAAGKQLNARNFVFLVCIVCLWVYISTRQLIEGNSAT